MYLYMHISPNGKKYVGITCQKPEKRWRKGKGYIKNEYFYRAIQKYGWDNFQHLIIFDDLTEDEANRLEEEYIRKYNLTDHNFGYNLHTGGLHHTETQETKEKISNSRKGLMVGKDNPFFGKKHTKETLEKIQKKVDQYSIDGEYIQTFLSVTEASKATSADKSDIVRACKGKRKVIGGYQWKYTISDKIIKPYKRKAHNSKKVVMYSIDGEKIATFESTAAASKAFDKNACASIGACCRGEQLTAYGYTWRYEE